MRRFWNSMACLALAGSVSGNAVANPRINAVSDGGFEPGTPNPTGYTAPQANRWAAEAAAYVAGPTQGVQPIQQRMLHIQKTSLAASQVSQRMDLSGLATEIDAGQVSVSWHGLFNSAESTASGGATLRARTGLLGSVLGSVSTGALDLDDNTASWEKFSTGEPFKLPPGTRTVEGEVYFTNASITVGGGGFVDETYLILKINELHDGCFDPNMPPLVSFTAPQFDRWAVEAAVVSNETLRILATQGVSSQASQYVDVSHLASLIDSGQVSARLRTVVNTLDPSAVFSMAINMRDGLSGPRISGTSTSGFTLDNDPNSWEFQQLGHDHVISVPSGTRVIEAQVRYGNSSLITGGYVDDVCLELICKNYAAGLGTIPLGSAAHLSTELSADPNDPNAPPVRLMWVDNLGSSGQDGIAMQLGDVHSAEITVAPLAPIEGNSRTVSAKCDDGSSISFTEQVSAGSMLVSADFSEHNATSHRILLFNNGTLVQDISGFTGPIDLQITPDDGEPEPTEIVWAIECLDGEDVLACYLPEVDVPSQISVPGETTAQANGWAIMAEGENTPATRITELSITGNETGRYKVKRGRLSLGDSMAESVGGSHIEGSGGATLGIIVHNIGSSGLDGVAFKPNDRPDVRVEDEQFIAFDASWDDPDPNTPMPGGALVFASAGQVDGASDQELGTLQIRRRPAPANELLIEVDYSPAGSQTQRLEVLSGGTIVATFSGHSGPVATVTSLGGSERLPMPGGCRKGRALIDDYQTACYNPFWRKLVRFNISGGPSVVGDEIRVLAENPAGEFEAIERFDVRAAGYPQLLVTGATFDVGCPGDADGNGVVGLTDLALLLGNFGQATSLGDLDGDGIVGLSDLAVVLAYFGETCP